MERDALIKAMKGLQRRQREVLVLRYFADMTEAQVAETLGISLGSVKAYRLARYRGAPCRHGGPGMSQRRDNHDRHEPYEWHEPTHRPTPAKTSKSTSSKLGTEL